MALHIPRKFGQFVRVGGRSAAGRGIYVQVSRPKKRYRDKADVILSIEAPRDRPIDRGETLDEPYGGGEKPPPPPATLPLPPRPRRKARLTPPPKAA